MKLMVNDILFYIDTEINDSARLQSLTKWVICS